MIVQACLNGDHPAAYHPNLPVTIEALVDDGRQVINAGASELHIHIRDHKGLESLHADRVDATIRALRAQLPGTLIGISTGAWIEKDDDRLLACIETWRVLPDYASVNLSEKVAPTLFEKLHRLGIGIEAGLARVEDAVRLLELGLARFALRMLVEVGEQEPDRANAVADEIFTTLGRSEIQKPVLLHGVDASAWPLLRRAIESGFSTRIGLEDTSILPDGSVAKSNVELVMTAIRLARTNAFSPPTVNRAAFARLKRGRLILLPAIWPLLCAPMRADTGQLMRTDFHVLTSDRFQIAVREVRLAAGEIRKPPPIILVHGLRVPGIASFDLPVPGGSLAADLANSGYVGYVMDARGYGNSTRPKAMDQPPAENRPLFRAYEVVRDIDAVVSEVQRRNQTDQVALFGWATGAMWCGMYTSQHPEAVNHLILLNRLYGGSSEHSLLGHGSSSEDHLHPGRFDEKAVGAYSIADARSLMSRWDSSIPLQDKSLWRDPAVAQAYQDAALASDPTSSSRNPASLRAPNGGLEESFYQAIGRPLYDGSSIVGSVLIVRSGNDFWRRPEDAETLASHLDHAKQVSVVTLPHATHFVHLIVPKEGGRN